MSRAPAELLKALETNGFAKDQVTLNYVYGNTAQDGQYSAGAGEAARILGKYLSQYGSMTVKEIKSL